MENSIAIYRINAETRRLENVAAEEVKTRQRFLLVPITRLCAGSDGLTQTVASSAESPPVLTGSVSTAATTSRMRASLLGLALPLLQLIKPSVVATISAPIQRMCTAFVSSSPSLVKIILTNSEETQEAEGHFVFLVHFSAGNNKEAKYEYRNHWCGSHWWHAYQTSERTRSQGIRR